MELLDFGDSSGQETPPGFGDSPVAAGGDGDGQGVRALLDAPTQRMSQAPTQLATQPLSSSVSAAPVFVVADPLDEFAGEEDAEADAEVDEDETQIFMQSLSQGHEADLRAAAARISEEEVPLEDAAAAVEADASTEVDGADSDLSDDMLNQDGASGFSSLAQLFSRTSDDDEPKQRNISAVFAARAALRASPANSCRDASESSGGETELEPEHEDRAESDRMPEPSTPQRDLRRSLSTPERSSRAPHSELGSASKRQRGRAESDSAQPKRIRLGGASSTLSSGNDTESVESSPASHKGKKRAVGNRDTPSKKVRRKLDEDNSEDAEDDGPQVTSSLPPMSRRRIALTPSASPSRSRSASVHSEAKSDKSEAKNPEQVCIVLTGLEPTPSIKKKIKAIAGATYQAAVEGATHVVAPENQLKRTVKLLCGISSCSHILDERWLDESARMGSSVDEKSYCLKDEAAETKWQFSLYETMYSVPLERRQQLFSGRRFFITNHKSVLPPVRDLVKIVECAGGQAVSKGSAGPDDIVISTEAALGLASVQKALAKADAQKVFSPELILTSILQQRVDLNAHRLEMHGGSSRNHR